MSTKKLIERMQDPAEWGAVSHDLPIFVEHGMYQLADGTKYAVVKGLTPPEGAKHLFDVDAKRLERINEKINKNFSLDKPIKIFKYHSSQEGSKHVGFFGPSRLEDWNGIKAIKSSKYVEKPYTTELDGWRERSPEFHPNIDELRGVALLPPTKEPRLPMGFDYQAEEEAGPLVCYAMGMGDDMPGGPDPATNPADPTALASSNSWTPQEEATGQRIWQFLLEKMPELQFLAALFENSQQPSPVPTAPGMVEPPPSAALGGEGNPSNAPPPPLSDDKDQAMSMNYEMENKALKEEIEGLKKKINSLEAAKAPTGGGGKDGQLLNTQQTINYAADDEKAKKDAEPSLEEIETVMYELDLDFSNSREYDRGVAEAKKRKKATAAA